MSKNTLNLETSGLDELINKLKKLEGDVKGAVTDALEQAAQTVEEDTREAVQPQYLPAHGKYQGKEKDTEKAIVTGAKATWHGTTAEINVGFDYSKPGAGGFLITGTPRMKPDKALQKIYKQKKYMAQLQADMGAVVSDYIREKMEGG